MAGWLDAAVRVFRRPPPDEPESTLFSVTCACGRSTSGTRRGEWQRVQCPSCGDILFVLPLNVYPRAKPKKPPAPRPSAPAVKVVPQSSVETSEDVPRSTQPEPAARPAPTGTPRTKERPAETFVRPRRRIVTGVRVLILAILAAVALTAWWAVRTQRRDQADTVVRTGVPLVEEALHEGDAAAALRELAPVVAALDVLNREDVEATAHRQLFRELTALGSLMPLSLFELVREAEQYQTHSDAEWARHFGTFKGRWIVLDAPVMIGSNAEGAEVALVDVPLMAGKRPFRIVLDLESLDGVEISDEPRMLAFAAQLDACRLATPLQPFVELRLDPKSAFLWCNDSTWSLAGFGDIDPELAGEMQKRLKAQRALKGVSP